MDKIENNGFYKEFFQCQSLKKACKLYFDVNSRFLATYGDETVNIISMDKGKDNITTSQIDQERFSYIISLQFVSQDNIRYRCDLACKMQNSNNIMIFELGKKEILKDRFMSYMIDDTELL